MAHFPQALSYSEAQFCYAEITEGNQYHSLDIARLSSNLWKVAIVFKNCKEGGEKQGYVGKVVVKGHEDNQNILAQHGGTDKRGRVGQWNTANLLKFSEIMNALTSTLNMS